MELQQSVSTSTTEAITIEKPPIKRLKDLRDVITDLDICEQAEILKILEKNKVKYTSNNNGIFINMSKLSCNILDEIDSFIIFVNNNYKKNLI